MGPREREWEARERRAAPAGRRAARVRAERALDRPRDDLREERRTRSSPSTAPPGRQSKTRWGAAGSASATRAPSPGSRAPRRRRRRRARPRNACARTAPARRRRSPRRERGRLELPERAHLRRRRVQAGLPPRRLLQLLRRRQRAEAVEHPLDEVHLRLRERRVEPDAARGQPVPVRDLDHVAPRRPREVGVVEDDARGARGESVVERRGDVAERAAELVAVQPLVPRAA